MPTELADRVRVVAEAHDLPESEVFERALERGLESLWSDVVLTRYLDGEVSRERAVDLVGESTVRRAEREAEAVVDDVEWGLDV